MFCSPLHQIQNARNMLVQQNRLGQAHLARPARICFELPVQLKLATVKRCDETLCNPLVSMSNAVQRSRTRTFWHSSSSLIDEFVPVCLVLSELSVVQATLVRFLLQDKHALDHHSEFLSCVHDSVNILSPASRDNNLSARAMPHKWQNVIRLTCLSFCRKTFIFNKKALRQWHIAGTVTPSPARKSTR